VKQVCKSEVAMKQEGLSRLIDQITSYRARYFEIGLKLRKINDQKLYLLMAKSFEEFCRQQLGMTRVHAYRYMSAASVVQNLEPIGYKPLNESQARPLGHLSVQKQRLAFQFGLDLAQAENRKITTSDIIKGINHLSKQASQNETLVMSQQMKRACDTFSKVLKKAKEDKFQTSSKMAIINQLQVWLRSIRRKK